MFATGEWTAKPSNSDLIAWLWTSIHARRSRSSPSLKDLAGRTPGKPITIEKEKLRVAVTGDAGFRNPAQAYVITRIKQLENTAPFDLFVHLGDTYYSGAPSEALLHVIQPFSKIDAKPKVAVCGNHDLYHGGRAFMAIIDTWNQPGRYVAVETPHWIVACLDTSLGARDFLYNEGELDSGQLLWFEELVKKKGDPQLILMSHHPPVSAWYDPPFPLNSQMRPFVDNIFSWYWGHEHSCVVYPQAPFNFFGACVGNGAFQEKWTAPRLKKQPTQWYATSKCTCFPPSRIWGLRRILNKRHFWPHGFLELELTAKQVVETYHVEHEKPYVRTLSVGNGQSQPAT
jgi:hypothetical protein